MRINKFIASSSKYSRRKADELIQAGKVFLNGKKVTTLGIKIDPETDEIKIEDSSTKPLTQTKKLFYFALHKPNGYITSRHDKWSNKTVMDLLPKIETLKPVGRLDKNSEGLLLFSNDGNFINKFTHPKFNCEKEYLVEIQGELTSQEKAKLEIGVVIENQKTHPSKIKIIKKAKHRTLLKIVIHEGRNRQIRKMFASLNHHVKYLHRLRIGSIQLNKLQSGRYRELTKTEINAN